MITAFIAIAIVLIGTAVALVATPLLRPRTRGGNAPVAAIVMAAGLPALTALMYVSVSNYEWNALAPAPAATAPAQSVPDAVRQLEQRLAATPDDAEGWMLLGRSYTQLQRFPEARDAFATAYDIAPSNEAKLALAEVQIMEDRANLAGEAGRMVDEVLAEEPDNPKALFYGGMVAMIRGDNDTLRARWQRLLDMSPPDNIRQMLEQQLAQLGPAPASAATGPSIAAGDVNDHGIDIEVSIADGLVDQINDDAILFVLARNPGASGPPIAAVRASARALPASLRISDANAMIPGRSLAGLAAVELVARVSIGGDAIAASGDLFGSITWNADGVDTRTATIVIDQIVE